MSKLQRLVLNHKDGTSEFIIKDGNAPAFDEAQNKTDEEKAQARANIGTDTLIVTIDGDTASHTAQQIYDHVQAGGTAVLNTSESIGIPLTEAYPITVLFGNHNGEEGYLTTWQIYDDGSAEKFEYSVSARLNSKISSPSQAKTGQTIIVQSVNSNGKPTAWRAADLPKLPNIIVATGIYLGNERCAIVQKDGECYYAGQMLVDLQDNEHIIFVHFAGQENPDNGGQTTCYTMIAESYEENVSLNSIGNGWVYENSGRTTTYNGKEYEVWGYA